MNHNYINNLSIEKIATTTTVFHIKAHTTIKISYLVVTKKSQYYANKGDDNHLNYDPSTNSNFRENVRHTGKITATQSLPVVLQTVLSVILVDTKSP